MTGKIVTTKGYRISEIMEILDVSRSTVDSWRLTGRRTNKSGIVSLKYCLMTGTRVEIKGADLVEFLKKTEADEYLYQKSL